MKFTLLLAALFMLAGSAFADTTSVTFTWTAPGDDGNVGTAAQYELRYSTSPITDANWASATQVTAINSKVPLIAGSAETFTTTLNLNGQTTYYFALKARDEAFNWALVSNNKSIVTPDKVPPSMIINLNATIN